MLRTRHALYQLPAVFLLATATPAPTEACDLPRARCRCVPPASGQTFEAFTRARYERADAVFQATVVRVDSLGPSTVRADGREWSVPRWAARLVVTAVWKGPKGDTATVMLARDSSCELWLDPGEIYLIFARVGRDGSYFTGQCTGTAEVTSAAATLAVLGPGRGPEDPRR